jgi:hypothetical protein
MRKKRFGETACNLYLYLNIYTSKNYSSSKKRNDEKENIRDWHSMRLGTDSKHVIKT